MTGESNRAYSSTATGSIPEVKTLEPGDLLVQQLEVVTRELRTLRKNMVRVLAKRDELVARAVGAGIAQREVAKAAKLTQSRVAQIVAKGAAS